jgi:uncharacterized protein with PQ loop repeat
MSKIINTINNGSAVAFITAFIGAFSLAAYSLLTEVMTRESTLEFLHKVGVYVLLPLSVVIIISTVLRIVTAINSVR